MKNTHLCTNCCHEVTCAYSHSRTQPVIFCEEFSYEAPAERAHPVPDREPHTPRRPETARICMNCDNTVYCTLKQSARAVYFCDEYR